MQPKESKDLDFTLDEILKEFSLPGEAVNPAEEEPVQPDEVPQTRQEPVSGDTVRMEPVSVPTPAVTDATVTFHPVSGETQAFRPVSQETQTFRPIPQEPEAVEPLSGDTAEYAPVSMPETVLEPEPIPAPAPQAPAQEAFSEDWEPEYEEPMGDYPQPIQFPSKNRQTVLRKKLVSGPEKLYHKLVGQGLGSLQLGIILHLVLLVLSAVGTMIPVIFSVSESNMRLLVFCQLVVIMVGGLLACYRMLVGIGNLIRKKFTLNVLLLLTFVACTVDGFLCLRTQQMPYATGLSLLLLMAQWAEYQRRNTQMSQMDTLRKALDVTAMVKLPNYYEGRSGYVSVEGDPDAFMEEYHKRSVPEKRLDLFGLVALGVAVLLMVYVGLRHDWTVATRVLCAALLAAVPASALVSMSRPAALLEANLHRLGAVLCGWKGIREADRHMIYPLTHKDLFPKECAKLNGVKFYGSIDPGRVVAYSAALINQDGDGMMEIFSHMPKSRNLQQYHVADFVAYPGGICGLVDGCPVMVGTQEFLTEMGVPVPDDVRIANAVYASLAGQFSAVFATQYTRSKSSVIGMRSLCGYHHVRPVMIACDFILTDRFIHNKLSVNPRRVEFPEREVRQHLAATPVPADAPVVALVTKNGLAPRACAMTGARVLRITMLLGAMVHIAAGAIGLLAVAVLALIGGFDVLSAANLFGYSLVWMLPGLLITEWTRYI